MSPETPAPGSGAGDPGAPGPGAPGSAASGGALEAVIRVLSVATGGAAEVDDSFGRPVATVPPEQWVAALTAARDELGATFFDWLTAVDELEDGYTVTAFVCAPEDAVDTAEGTAFAKAQGVLLKTRVPRDRAELPTATTVYRGANWHERETFEMFGVVFDGHPDLKPLLLPDGFEGHPLRKEFILAARVAKAWPGAKEPGESDHDRGRASPGRRRMLPPGVPGEEWLKPAQRTGPDNGGHDGDGHDGDGPTDSSTGGGDA